MTDSKIPAATAARFIAIVAERHNYDTARRLAQNPMLCYTRRVQAACATERLRPQTVYGREFPLGTWADMAVRSGCSKAWLQRQGSKADAAWAVWRKWRMEGRA